MNIGRFATYRFDQEDSAMNGEWTTRGTLGAPSEWIPGCPLLIERIEAIENTTTGKLYLRAALRNIGTGSIKQAIASGEARGAEKSCRVELAILPQSPINPGESFEAVSKAISLDKIDSADLSVESVTISPEQHWEAAGDSEPLPERQNLDLSEKAAKQRKKELTTLFRGDEEKVRAAFPYKTVSDVDWWQCSCGAINSGRSECWKCSAGKPAMIPLQDEEGLEKAADDEKEKELAQERKRQERKDSLKKRRPLIVGGGIAIVAVAVACVLGTTVLMPMIHANAGDNARSQGNWDTAISEYDAANGYGESAFYSAYTKCLQALSEGSGEKAALGDLLDGEFDLSKHVDDMLALGDSYLNAEDYDSAVNCYESIGDYADSNDRIIDAYKSASDSLLGKGTYGGYIAAVGLLERAAEYSGDDKLVYDTACDCAQKMLDGGEPDKAMQLYETANDHGDAKEKMDYCKSVQDLTAAEEDFQDGKLAAAQAGFNALPADLSYNGVNAGQRQSLLSSRQGFVDAAGNYSGSSHVKVTQTSNRTGSQTWWETNEAQASAEVHCKLSDDGTATVWGVVSFYRYTNFSIVASGVHGRSVVRDFTFEATEMPSSVDIGDGVTISISDGSFTFDFHEHKENEDIYFTYDYDSSGTLAKS